MLRRPEDGRPPYGFFRNRVIFPVSDQRGRIVAFGGRVMEGDGPKYVNSPEHALFHKGSVLYGLARARSAIAKGARPVVVEGYMDVISFQSAGLGGAVAPLGTALGEGQLAELWKAQDEKAQRESPPILCFDGDNAGRKAAMRAVERILPLLGPSRSVSVAFLPPGEDPDSLVRKGGSAAGRRALEGALPLIDAVWQFATQDRALATPEQRAGLWAELDAQLGRIADGQVRSLYRVELRRRFDAWEALRGAVFEALTVTALDARALGRQLRSAGYGPILDDILGPETIRHARFVKPETPAEEVRAYWLDIWDRIDRRRLIHELESARSDPNKCEDQAMERISRLGERVYYGAVDRREARIGVDHEAIIARVIAEALKAPAKDRHVDDSRNLDSDL